MRLTTFTVLITLFWGTTFSGAHLSAQNIDRATRILHDLTESGLMVKYRQYRARTEEWVALFKLRQTELPPEATVRMQTDYRLAAESFEAFIRHIRNDLLDKKARRQVRRDPEAYITSRLTELDGLYAEFVLKGLATTYAETTGIDLNSRRVGLPPLEAVLLIPPIVDATTRVIGFFDDKSEKRAEEWDELLEREWIRPNQFRKWEEI